MLWPPTPIDWLALVSRPSGRNSFSVATMQPCVSRRVFSITSTPNWTMSPELTSYGSDSVLVWLRRTLLMKVPLLLPVSCNRERHSHLVFNAFAEFNKSHLDEELSVVVP